jgi:hypothetical protein
MSISRKAELLARPNVAAGQRSDHPEAEQVPMVKRRWHTDMATEGKPGQRSPQLASRARGSGHQADDDDNVKTTRMAK